MTESSTTQKRSERDLLVDIATSARAFLKAHGIVEDWENAYEEAEDLETALQEWEATLRV
jgi:hypothetical protein